MNRRSGLALAGLLVLFGLLPLFCFSAEEESYSVYEPEGYVATVDELIAAGELTYDCAGQRVVPSPALEADFFFDQSYLRGDVAAWNGGDRRPFTVEHEELRGGGCRGELVRVNAGYHRQRLPSYTASGWRGRLFMSQEAAGTVLASRERTIELTRPPLAGLPLDARRFEDLWFVPGRPRDARSAKLAFKMLEEGRSFAALETIGDAATVEVLQSQPEMILNGCALPRGVRLRLDSGDSLRLTRTGGRGGGLDERFSVDAGDRAGLLSFVSTVNGELRRRTVARRLALADDVVQAVDAAVVLGGGERDFDVHLSLDAFYQDLLSRLLEGFVAGRYGDRPLRAGVTLLEPASGRVLALASYPTPAALGRLAVPAGADPGTLARNHNLVLHPVGSAAKPFLAAGALATRPELAGLEVRCFPGGEAPEEILGYELGEYHLPADCQAVAGTDDYGVDLVDFLRVSSNRYMLYLGLLSMADWHGGAPLPDPAGVELAQGDRYRLGSGEQRLRPRLPIVKSEAVQGTELGDVAEQELLRNLRRLFGLSYQYQSGIAAERLEREYWQPVLDRAPGIAERAAELWAFDRVTPEEVNLAANLVQSFRQDLYTLLLGLGDNRWSNLQLAQATGRLLTGDGELRAHLVDKVTRPVAARGGEERDEVLWSLDEEENGPEAGADAGGAAPAAAWPLAEPHRQLLLRGMAAVVESPGGTAHALRGTLGELNRRAPGGIAYRLFAKTGTPTMDPSLLIRQGTVPDRGRYVRYPGGFQAPSAVLVLGVERSAPGEAAEHLVLTFWIEGQGGSDEAVALAGELLPPLVEGHWPRDWLRPE